MQSLLTQLLGQLPWQLIVAYLINSVGVVLAADQLKKHRPDIKPHLPWLAPIMGALLPVLAQLGSNALGYDLDFAPILGFFSGSVSVTLHQFAHQRKKKRLGL